MFCNGTLHCNEQPKTVLYGVTKVPWTRATLPPLCYNTSRPAVKVRAIKGCKLFLLNLRSHKVHFCPTLKNHLCVRGGQQISRPVNEAAVLSPCTCSRFGTAHVPASASRANPNAAELFLSPFSLNRFKVVWVRTLDGSPVRKSPLEFKNLLVLFASLWKDETLTWSW